MHACMHKKEENSAPAKDENDKFYCSVCGREIDEEEYETYSGLRRWRLLAGFNE